MMKKMESTISSSAYSTLYCRVGAFVVLGFAVLFFLALKVGNMSTLSFRSTYAVALYFDNIGTLKVHAPVKSAGVTVGRVARIEFDDQNYRARVTLAIESPYRFPKDTSAQILTSGILGEQYIGLAPGADEQMLVAGDVIAMTQSAIVLESLISRFLYDKATQAGGKPGKKAS
jgi:phospholipid/cholesterol/gamma-HCH transport system substrate-binding protein